MIAAFYMPFLYFTLSPVLAIVVMILTTYIFCMLTVCLPIYLFLQWRLKINTIEKDDRMCLPILAGTKENVDQNVLPIIVEMKEVDQNSHLN